MSAGISWVAICKYPDKAEFRFFSPAFVVAHWADLEAEGARVASEAWSKISPHPAPPVIDFLPGVLEYVSAKERASA